MASDGEWGKKSIKCWVLHESRMDFGVAFRSAKWALLQVPLSETPNTFACNQE
jgi:hypothetical protein